MSAGMKKRVVVAGMAMTAMGLVAYTNFEGYAPTAVPPVAGDVPTYGFGSTRDADGRPVQAGAVITPLQAVQLAARDVRVHEAALKKCLDGVVLLPYEFDAYMSLALNVGPEAVCGSSIPAKLRAGEYEKACQTILDFSGFCTKPKVRNAAGRRVCPPGAMKKLPGLVKRREAEHQMCMGER